MKKLSLLGLYVLCSLSSNAQLRVDNLGKTYTENLQSSAITVSGNSLSSEALSVGGTINFANTSTDTKNRGVRIIQYGNHSQNDAIGLDIDVHQYGNVRSMGIKSICYGGIFRHGVIGATDGSFGTCLGRTGIYGSTTSTWTYFSGTYAGYFNGDVKTTGTIYGTLVSPSSVSSPSGGGTTTNLSEQSTTRGETITERLQQVDLLQMERVNQNGSLAANKIEERGTCIDEEGKEVEAEEPIQTKLSPISYGLAADQLQEVFPELVYEDAEGNYSINYVEMVPLLVQSIRELSAEVATLKQKLGISDPAKPVLKTKGKAEDADNVTLTLPDESQQATLNIYDLNGRLLRTTSVDATSANLSSHTHGLPAGTYAYSLNVNGKKLKARKVIIK